MMNLTNIKEDEINFEDLKFLIIKKIPAAANITVTARVMMITGFNVPLNHVTGTVMT